MIDTDGYAHTPQWGLFPIPEKEPSVPSPEQYAFQPIEWPRIYRGQYEKALNYTRASSIEPRVGR